MWPDFEIAVNEWRAANPSAGRPREQLPRPVRPEVVPARPGLGRGSAPDLAEDLVSRRPGHNAAAMAEALRPRWRAVRVLARLVGWRTRDRSWRVGAAGGSAVGARLDRLTRRSWRVLHGVSFGGGGDVDHLLIGPAGVLCVNTKHHPGARVRVGRDVVFVRGKPTAYVAKAHREAERVQRALVAAWGRPVYVAPVLVFHGHRSLRGWLARRPRAVQVLPSWAAGWFCRLPGPTVLSAGDVEALYALARQPVTWARV